MRQYSWSFHASDVIVGMCIVLDMKFSFPPAKVSESADCSIFYAYVSKNRQILLKSFKRAIWLFGHKMIK